MRTTAPYFFISYSREDANLQRRIIAELRSRGIHVWVDIENLIPGSPAWEREIERSIRGAAGVDCILRGRWVEPGSLDDLSRWLWNDPGDRGRKFTRPQFFAGRKIHHLHCLYGVQQQDVFSREIFVMDLYTAEKWQLTDNDYCDYQPRWGS